MAQLCSLLHLWVPWAALMAVGAPLQMHRESHLLAQHPRAVLGSLRRWKCSRCPEMLMPTILLQPLL